MRPEPRLLLIVLGLVDGFSSVAQTATKLAETGHCAEAIPQLKRQIRTATDLKLKRQIGVAGVRCAMSMNRPDDAVDFLRVLERDFPNDPEVLYMATHAYSDLSVRASQRLLYTAPSSPQVHKLNAEALEAQGKWDEAASEYRRVLEMNPKEPGIHYLLGRLILSRPKTETTIEDARKEMAAELEIDPSNAGAEFVLGEISRQAEDWAQATEHFRRATEHDASFVDAYFGLGRSLMASGDFAGAVKPLEQAAKMQPDNPTMHYQLSIAYSRVGRKEDAQREAKLQEEAAARAQATKDKIQLGVKGEQPPSKQ
jgi:tetratricopeptide (TPR) repeat protein